MELYNDARVGQTMHRYFVATRRYKRRFKCRRVYKRRIVKRRVVKQRIDSIVETRLFMTSDALVNKTMCKNDALLRSLRRVVFWKIENDARVGQTTHH